MNSDKHINYNLRPSKSIERKMMLEVYKEVCTPNLVNEYQYIGFGSSFFSDFKIIHQELNIDKMISIEGKNTKLNIERCNFNKPFKCIQVEPGMSYEVLPLLDWKHKSIIWLDYDDPLKTTIFEDIEVCCQKAKSGNLLSISLRCDIDSDFNELKNEFEDYILNDHTEESFEPANLSNTLREMFLAKIEKDLSDTYSSSPLEKKLVFKQLFNFNYKDGTKMLTFGGMFIENKEISDFKNYKFLKYSFISTNDKITRVDFPIITNKEYLLLSEYVPSDDINSFLEEKEIEFIPLKHRKNFFTNYRYYPKFIELKEL